MTVPVPRDAPALVSALAHAPEGAEIRLAAATYELTAPLVIARGVTLKGEPGATRIVARGTRAFALLQPRTEVCFSGLVVEGGRETHGGALAAQHGAILRIDRCRFRRNVALEEGGAIHLSGVRSVTIVRTIFEENEAQVGGGAVTMLDGGELTCDRCLFVANRASVGGGIFLRADAAMRLLHCTMADNEAMAGRGGGAIFVLAGATRSASVFLANCVVAGARSVGADPSTAYSAFVRHSIVPADTFATKGIENVTGNTLAEPELADEARGEVLAFALAPGSPGTGTAEAEWIPRGDTDLAGRRIPAGRVDPGALAGS